MNLTKRQNEIIEKSLELISKNGIQGLTIKNLSKEIGISEPAIYRHFENKSKILKTILLIFKFQIDKTFYKLNNLNLETKSKIDMFFTIHLEKFLNSPHISSVIFSEELFINEPELSIIINEIMKTSINNMSKIIKKGQEKNEICKELTPEDLSIIMLGSLRLLIKDWYLSGFQSNLKEKVNNLKNTIIKIIGEKGENNGRKD